MALLTAAPNKDKLNKIMRAFLWVLDRDNLCMYVCMYVLPLGLRMNRIQKKQDLKELFDA